jgi:heptosyltransferase-2
MKKTLVVHPYPGIGDLIWHIPYIRAIAQQSANGKVSVLARPACRADDILAGETCVEEVLEDDYKRRDRSTTGRNDGFFGKFRLAAELRTRKFDRIVIFSDRNRYGLVAALAGIPDRLGYGFRLGQRLWLTHGPYIQPHNGSGSPVYDEASRFAIAQGYVDQVAVPKITVPAQLLDEMRAQLSTMPKPRYAFAIGASEAKKQWGGARFLELGKHLIDAGSSVIFLGGPAERNQAEELFTSANGLRPGYFDVMCQSSVLKSAAMLHTCDFTIGNDTGALNLSAACDVPALGLFGHTLPLLHDPIMHGISAASMEEISVNQVLTRLAELQTVRSLRSLECLTANDNITVLPGMRIPASA